MELSLEFLKSQIGQKANVSLIGADNKLRFRGIQVLAEGATLESGMLYACVDNEERLACCQAVLPDGAGVIVCGEQVVPEGVPALIFHEQAIAEAFCLVHETFLFFGEWQERVYRKALEQPGFDSLMSMLNEVTPNPWYIADGSYRVLAARNAPDVEEISYIWNYLYRNKHLPLETILAMEDMGKIEQMSRIKTAYIPTVEPFNIPFVSKAINTIEGEVAHFYIIGVYTRLSSYEIEIAEFFGNVLNQMLAKDDSRMPAMGRFYDSFLSSLIAQEPPDSARTILEKMCSDLGWKPSDRFRLIIFSSSANPESISDRQKLLTIESRCRARSFFHNGHVTAIIDVEGLERDTRAETDALAMLLRPLTRVFRCSVGVSEAFSGLNGIMSLDKWYDQALFCIESCDVNAVDEGGGSTATQPIVLFPSVAIRYFQSRVSKISGIEPFVHPALDILRNHDEANRANLMKTLRVYLENDRNVTLTAKLLYVHRNTLLKRINKIVSLTSLDLDDAECRKRLLVSFLVTDSSISK